MKVFFFHSQLQGFRVSNEKWERVRKKKSKRKGGGKKSRNEKRRTRPLGRFLFSFFFSAYAAEISKRIKPVKRRLKKQGGVGILLFFVEVRTANQLTLAIDTRRRIRPWEKNALCIFIEEYSILCRLHE
jgi:hypothetical protein